MGSLLLLLGSIFAGLGVALGAFGAHALKGRLDARQLETFETGARYQMYHALALLAAGAASALRPGSPLPQLAGWLFVAGMLLFSGSLYLLALSGKRGFGAITPLGGLAFIAGWACLGLAALRL